MIIPTDYNLLENVSFYDPVQQRIYFKKEFWTSFFPRLRYDFKLAHGYLPPDISSFTRDIKTKIFQYYYKKFILQEEKVSSLYGDIESVFQYYKSQQDFESAEQYRNARVLERQDTALTLVQVGRPSSPTFTDKLLDHFAILEERSSRELSLQVSFDEFALQFESEERAVTNLKSDYESGALAKFLASDFGFAGCLITAKSLTDHYKELGIATAINMLQVSRNNDGMFSTTKDFTIDRYHFFDKSHSSNEAHRALTAKIGKDKCLYIYETFLKEGYFCYDNVFEYVFSCHLCTSLIPVAQKSVFRSRFNWLGSISRTELSAQKSKQFQLNPSSGFGGFGKGNSNSSSSPVGSLVSTPTSMSGFGKPYSSVSGRESPDGSGFSRNSGFSTSSKWSGFGGSNPR